MSLKGRLMEDLKSAMKSKEKVRKNVITMVRASVKQIEVDQRIEITDEDIIEIIAKQVKQKRDALEDFNKADRQDLVELTEGEIEILSEYLPQQLTEEEIDEIVKMAVDEVGANSSKDMGKVMGLVMPKVKGKADGSIVNRIVRQYLK